MSTAMQDTEKRQRAPSRRSLQTRARILDAAEHVFAERGFEGATIRDIAGMAGVQVGLVHHHGGGKEALFRLVVARRADTLSQLRLAALAERSAEGKLDLDAILTCFFGPYLEMAANDAQWLAYARLVAHVSADPRWSEISAAYFDPTAGVFIDRIAALYPGADRLRIASGFVYSVSAMLALLTSRWRIAALGDVRPGAQRASGTPGPDALDQLVRFSAAGIDATLS